MPTLLGPDGRPLTVSRAELTRPMRLIDVGRLGRAQSLLRGLPPSGLAVLLDSAAAGVADDYLTLAEEMEERDPHYAAVLATRKRAVLGLPRRVMAASDAARDVALRDAVEQHLLQNAAFSRLLAGLLDALGKGYAAVEILWATDRAPWRPQGYVWRDPRCFQYDRATGQTLRLRTAAWGEGEPLPPGRFVVHQPQLKAGLPIRGGLARLAAIASLCRHLAMESWLAYAESYGAPVRLAKADDRLFPADPTERSDFVADLQAKLQTLLGADAYAVLPKSVDIELQASPIGHADIYQALVEYLEKSISKAVLGRADAADATPGRLGGEQFSGEVRRDLLESDAEELSTTLNDQLVRGFIDLNFGVQAAYPRLELYVPDPEDLAGLTDLLTKLVPLGLKVEQSVIRDKWGLPDPAPDAELLGSPSVLPAENPVANAGNSVVPAPAGTQNRALNRGSDTGGNPDPTAPLVERLGRDADPLLDALLEPVRQALSASGDLMDFRERLLTLYPELDGKAFAELMGQALAVADAAGYWEAQP